ncbi:CdaR family transcriptional regulator [Streptomyces sp. B93]|uniref:PucR family transcriptional regulator n=1 Tax=Streptomyces sp. B93 TaxID=2824875 RepID=UPI001B392BBE|nr:helix-turn-helix domain-containing protein [Streptomyces sp. B93]MBQ1088309.1 helix-turn-helix domain-containing protein [Streptomyces sp. B93]
MQQALRPRTATRLRPTAVPPPRAGRPVRSLIDADAIHVLHRAARVLQNDLPDLTDRLVAVLQEEEPSYRSAMETEPVATWQEVHRSLRHSVASLLDPRGARDGARRCTWKIGARRAEQGIPLDALLHAFRLGGSLVWQGLVEETSRTAPEDIRLLVHVASDVWNFVDEHCTLVADAYRQVERQLAWRRENRVRVLAAALLDGTSRIADLPEAAEVLDLPESGRYVVVAIAGGHPAQCADARALAVPPGLPAHWHSGAEADYGIVLVGDGDLPEPVLEPTGPTAGVRIGIGGVVEGLAAVGEARGLADTALTICPPEGGAVRLADHLPAALIVTSPELGAALSDRVLGPLARMDPADREVLLDTLAAWLACDGSAQRAARRLYCHRNTVLNRLRRFEQLTTRSLARPSDLAEITLALTARRLLRP